MGGQKAVMWVDRRLPCGWTECCDVGGQKDMMWMVGKM